MPCVMSQFNGLVKSVKTTTVKPAVATSRSPCARCSVRMSSFCGVLNLGRGSLKQTHEVVRARRTIHGAGDVTDDFVIICEGWTACSMRLSDGRRQILSFLIPGDPVSITSLFNGRQRFSVQSLTDVRYCMFSRKELQKEMIDNSRVFQELVKICIAEKEQADQIIVSLGRQSAAARIARLILLLMERLGTRGLVRDQSFEFPLRQQHIADAMGLTTVHVSRVINMFRKEGLVDIAQRRIRILSLKELQRVADAK